jgi:NAD(P)-dependent dehydrogenase (short-subunit alcohol dehydrogenase family)
MTTIAIIGAGRGLGAAVARKFGDEGFDVALISRSQDHIDALAADLTNQGIRARGYAASVRDPATLVAALDRASQELSPIEVVQYSPIPQPEFLRPMLETTVADLTAAVEFSLYGPVTAATRRRHQRIWQRSAG